MINRIAAIQSELESGDLFLVSEGANRLYFTGFSSSAGILLISKKDVSFLIDFRYYEKAKAVIKHCNVSLLTNKTDALNDYIKKHNIKKIYLETSYLSIDTFSYYKKVVPSDCIVSSSPKMNDAIQMLRRIKSQNELENIKAAQKITDDTFKYILNHIAAGKTEREIMLEMEFYLRKQGSEGVAFDFIVVSGKNSSLPHGVPTDKPIEIGDFITMDFGAVVNGYRSDMTRTIALGKVDKVQEEVYQTVLRAQKLALESIKPGRICKEIDRVARDYIDNCGYKGFFGHGLGHSVGLDIHEAPSFNTTDTTALEPGMVLTVEPGIYLPNQFGVRIEDMVYITEDHFENLTSSPKELIVL